MVRHYAIVLNFVVLFGLVGCAGAGGDESTQGRSVLKVPENEVPAEVRAIEVQIDRKSALIADEVEIYVSRNYEWDIALTGDIVHPQKASGVEQVSMAEGHARASFRNLEIRAWGRIVFRKSGFDVSPFIKVTARGNAVHTYLDSGDAAPLARRAATIRIDNEQLHFSNETSERVVGDSIHFDRPVVLRGN